MDYKSFFSLFAIILGFACMVPYFYDIFRNKTKPHAFSWFIWSLLMGTAFIAQLIGGAGLSSWITGSGAILCFLIAFISYIKNGLDYVKMFDWICLFLAISGILFWLVTSNPLYAILIVTFTDALGFLPAFRKAYQKPYEETLSTYFLIAVKHGIGVLTLQNYSLITYLFPLYLTIGNALFAILIILRRRVIERN